MTSLNYQETAVSGFPAGIVPSPQGWVTTGIHVIDLNAKRENGDAIALRTKNLGLAAKCTEHMIKTLAETLGIEVSVSYMRIETDTLFHFLLIINEQDFHSKIISARMLAEQFSKTEGYEIKFVFAIDSENRMNHTMKFGGYKMMFKAAPKNMIAMN